jgi:hypothetical protein
MEGREDKIAAERDELFKIMSHDSCSMSQSEIASEFQNGFN